MGIRISFVALAAPLILLALLLAAPGVDKSWGTSSFHFYVVSSASLLAAGTCVVLVISARSIRQTRILFLALSFFSLATIFSVHGLATPGHLIHDPTAAIVRSPWLASLAAGFFAALSVLTIPRIVEQSRLRLPEIIVCVSVAGGWNLLRGQPDCSQLAGRVPHREGVVPAHADGNNSRPALLCRLAVPRLILVHAAIEPARRHVRTLVPG